MTYKYTATLATPNFDADQDVVYPLELVDKRALHRVEKAMGNALMTLVRITAGQLDSGEKAPKGTNPQLTTLTVEITKDGADYGGYTHRWPGQSDEARAFLKGLFDGAMAEAGQGRKKQVRPKGHR